MALKKSELYSSLWSMCDGLRGGMDASQYKDYVLVLLFIKYISDKYANVPYAPISVPKGASFADMIALKGKPDIGDQINKTIIAPLANANKLSDFPDFNDATKLGSGKEMVDRLTDLIAVFENPALDFSKNRADGDDILGDAYEYLMRHFATESGKSKGQFYTPAEVSRIIAQILEISKAKTSPDTTVYDPTCGSGSLLLKVADEASSKVTLYGQEKDAATSGLARMNMILHNNPTALVVQGNTLTDPKFRDGSTLKTFDYVVANPPFSDKRWSTGLDPLTDPYERFKPFGTPPGKQGDYAYLLHIVRSMKSTGRGACILPHGVLFRGNAEADIRRNLVRKGYIKGIIGLPANLFYGTGIPACIVVVDKYEAHTRKGIFMIDAGSGFMKDGPKNRLRAQDIHKIVDVFNRHLEVPKYSRMVSFDEIEKHDFNLNLPRYIDSQQAEDLQDIEGHLKGGIPERDIEALGSYWTVCPELRHSLFKANRPGYVDLAVDKSVIKTAIYEHVEFAAFITGMNEHFATWRHKTANALKALESGCHPKTVISKIAEELLAHYLGKPLMDPYAVYQHLLDYWAETMQDDCYLISADGWRAQTARIIEKDKKGKEKDKGWACDLVPKALVVARYFSKEQTAIDQIAAEFETVAAKLAELEEERGGDEGAFSELEKLNMAEVTKRMKEIKGDKDAADEAAVLNEWLKLSECESDIKKRLRDAEAGLDTKAYAQYPKLSDAEVKTLVVDNKWLAALDAAIHGEMDRISQALTRRLKELAERYEAPMPVMVNQVAELEAKMNQHLKKDGVRMELMPGYKQTEVGVIPGDWNVALLDSVARRGSGHTPDKSHPEYWGGQVKWISLQDSHRLDRLYIRDTEAKITPAGLANSSAKLHPAGTVVLSRDAGVGKSAIMTDCMSVSQHFMAWVCGSSLNNRFLFYWLQANKPEFERIAMGNTIKTIGLPYFRQLRVPLPCVTEQEAIAQALADADALIKSLEQLIAKKRQVKHGVMQELLTGKKRLPGFDGEWVARPLGQIAPLQRGFDLPTAQLSTGPYPVVYSNGMLNYHRSFQVKGPGVVTGRSGTIGAVTFVECDFWPHNTALWVTSFKDNDPKFVFYLYTLIGLEQFATGSGVPTLNRNDVHAHKVNVPRTRNEQIAIAEVLTELDAQLAALGLKIAKARQIKQGMMQQLLTGRIRLV